MSKSKVSIIGAGGNVGSIVAYSIAMQGLAHEVILVDRDVQRAKGKALDIAQSSSVDGFNVKFTGTDSYEDIKNSILDLSKKYKFVYGDFDKFIKEFLVANESLNKKQQAKLLIKILKEKSHVF